MILLTTLALGVVLGALLFSTVQRYRFGPAIELTRPRYLIAGIEEVVQPRSEAQRLVVREILRTTEERLLQLREERRHVMHRVLASLDAGLAPHLQPDQLERLRHHLRERERAVGRRLKSDGRSTGERP